MDMPISPAGRIAPRHRGLKHLLALLLVAAGACGLGATARAADIYRCGPDGSQYSATPCPGGRAVTVDDRRDAAQWAQAREVAARDQALADRMAAERRAADAAASRQKAVGIMDSRAAERREAERVADTAARRAAAPDARKDKAGKSGKAGSRHADLAPSGLAGRDGDATIGTRSIREVRLPKAKASKPAAAGARPSKAKRPR